LDTGPFVAELMTIIGYVMIFVGIYKLFQISSDLGEIKELLKSQRGVAAQPGAFGPPRPELSDPADAYAENLLRAVNQESREAEQTAARQD
jgi:hypothetical protein